MIKEIENLTQISQKLRIIENEQKTKSDPIQNKLIELNTKSDNFVNKVQNNNQNNINENNNNIIQN